LWFAHAIPYTFSEMQEKVAEMKNCGLHDSYLKTNIFCFSLARIPIPLLTITDNVNSYLDYYEEIRMINQIPPVVKKQMKQKLRSAVKMAK
jgi:hypothetical protein